MGDWHHRLARGAARGCVIVAFAFVAVSGSGCGDEVEDINSWASENRSGIFAKLDTVGYCLIGFGGQGPVDLNLSVDHPVVEFLNVTFAQSLPKHQRYVGVGTATVFFTDAPGYESANVAMRYEIEAGDAIPYIFNEGPSSIMDRALTVHRLIIDPVEVTHGPSGRTATVGGALNDVRIICGDGELGTDPWTGE